MTDAERLKAMYRAMLTARRFDEAQIAFYKTGKVHMESVHSHIGQEAIGVGAGFAMRQGDMLVPSLRSRPAFFALGVPLNLQWAGVLSREAAPGKGLIGSRHMTAHEYGIVGTTGIVGAHVPVATGVAMAQKMDGKGAATVCLFGDGAANRGECHEGMNMAAVFGSPVVFVCEANGVAESQHWESYMPIDDLSVRAAGYGMPGYRIDGNNVQQVHDTVAEALARAREGGGPSFIVAETCRMHPHVEGLPDFRDAKFLDDWRARDPIDAARRLLVETHGVSAESLDAMNDEVETLIDQAREEALQMPLLDPARLADLVFSAAKEH